MLIVYDGPHDAVAVPALDLVAERGVPVEIDPDGVDVATELIKQACWSQVQPAPPEPEAAPGYDAWGVAQLRAELGRRGLHTQGYRQQLITRLVQHDADNTSTDPTADAADGDELDQTKED